MRIVLLLYLHSLIERKLYRAVANVVEVTIHLLFLITTFCSQQGAQRFKNSGGLLAVSNSNGLASMLHPLLETSRCQSELSHASQASQRMRSQSQLSSQSQRSSSQPVSTMQQQQQHRSRSQQSQLSRPPSDRRSHSRQVCWDIMWQKDSDRKID